MGYSRTLWVITHIFDIGARGDSNSITSLDTQVVADDTVDASSAILDVLVRKDNQDSVLAFLAAGKDGVTTEQLKKLHGLL